jgi:hypothetical protein
MIAHLQYFDAEPLGQSEQVVPGPFLEESQCDGGWGESVDWAR